MNTRLASYTFAACLSVIVTSVSSCGEARSGGIKDAEALPLAPSNSPNEPTGDKETIVIDHAPQGLANLSPNFRVTVSGTPISTYVFDRSGPIQYHFAHFSFQGFAHIDIEGLTSPSFSSASLSPKSFEIASLIQKNHLFFTLTSSQYVIVKIDKNAELILAADVLESSAPLVSDSDVIDVTEAPYNADRTGSSLSTLAIQRALDDANARGGGTVFLSPGLYRTANLVLKSNVTLYLHGDACLRASSNSNDFKVLFYNGHPGDGNASNPPQPGTWFIATAPGSQNISIRGRGVIDGMGSILSAKSYFLNNLIVPIGTTNFTLDGIVGWDAGSWAINMARSSNVTVKNYKGMQSRVQYQDDGIDVNECQNVKVNHTIVVSRDDCYSTKSWHAGPGIAVNWPGDPQPVENVLFQDVVAWTTDGAFKIGQGAYQPQRDISFDHGYVYGSHWALYVRPDTPANSNAAVIQNISYSNIFIENSPTWFGFYGAYAPVSNLTLKNINVAGSSNVLYSAGVSTLSGLTIENIVVNGKVVSSLQ